MFFIYIPPFIRLYKVPQHIEQNKIKAVTKTYLHKRLTYINLIFKPFIVNKDETKFVDCKGAFPAFTIGVFRVH